MKKVEKLFSDKIGIANRPPRGSLEKILGNELCNTHI